MNGSTFQLTMAVLNTACVLIVIAYFLIRSGRKFTFSHGPENAREFIAYSLVFGFFSLYAGFNAIKAFGAVVSLRHTGPIVGGFFAGPWVGMTAGLIGGVDRFLQGGASMGSATLAVILAGTMAGVYVKYWKKGKMLSVWEAASFTVVYEGFASVLTFVFVPDFNEAFKIEQGIRLPLVIGNAIGVALFVGCVKTLAKERDLRQAKEQIENELNVARNIQMSMVPKLFPTPPDVPEFDLHAVLRPMKEVGGDFYNFLSIDDDHFCFMVGDVSGKGVPASLFMAVAKTLVESEARSSKGHGCDQMMARANEELCRGNSELMFVTVFLAVLNIRTGEVEYCSAGHPPPFSILRTGEVNQPPCQPGCALGVMEGMRYTSRTLSLAPGDALVLFTDGVTEAFTPTDEMFGEEGLAKTLGSLREGGRGLAARDLTKIVTDSVDAFSGDAHQSDDVTVLALKFLGSTGRPAADLASGPP